MRPTQLVVYSDFLCPWCWNAATKLASVQSQIGDALSIEWRSYLLRPQAQPGRDRLFRAYFAESRDISDAATLRALWSEAGLDAADFDAIEVPARTREVLADHAEAQALGATGVPAVRLADHDFVLVGAQPEAVYLRWLQKVAAAT